MSDISGSARRLFDLMKDRGLMLATAESCTGGMVAVALTDIAGSSVVFDRGFVTYSNAAKVEMLGVPEPTLAAHGAVSRETALAMAEGALARSDADIAISVTGIAGPDGGTPQKPVGLVWFGLAGRAVGARAEMRLFADRGRAAIRHDAAVFALELAASGAGSVQSLRNSAAKTLE